MIEDLNIGPIDLTAYITQYKMNSYRIYDPAYPRLVNT